MWRNYGGNKEIVSLMKFCAGFSSRGLTSGRKGVASDSFRPRREDLSFVLVSLRVADCLFKWIRL